MRRAAGVLLWLAAAGCSVSAGWAAGAVVRGASPVALLTAPMLLVLLLAATNASRGGVWRPRVDGGRLVGRGVAGSHGIDLHRLTSVAGLASQRGVSLLLRDDRDELLVQVRSLQPGGAFDAVARAVGAAASSGQVAVPTLVGRALGVPPTPGAGATGRTGLLRQVALVLLVLVGGMVVGLAVASG